MMGRNLSGMLHPWVPRNDKRNNVPICGHVKHYAKGFCKSCWNKLWRGPKNRKYNLKQSYGITEEDYAVILEQQRGVCAICGDGPNAHWVRSQKNKVLAVDHDHKTGKIRGLLCAKCNAGLGAFLDNPKLLRKAVKYLKGRMGESNGKEERK